MCKNAILTARFGVARRMNTSPPETTLCLVARAAWTLWNDDVPMVETGKYVGLEVVVKNNTSLIAMISLDVGRTGTEEKGLLLRDAVGSCDEES